jgi:hypothetical protein
MKAKYIFFTGTALIIMALCTYCKKNVKIEPEPEAIVVSAESVAVEKGKQTEITISNGKSPFSVSSVNQTVATVSISENKITIIGISEGETKVDITSADNAKKQITVTVSADPYEAFKTDATLRFELNGETIKNRESNLLFIKDAGQFFSSTKSKVGFGKKDGSTLTLIEWNGDNSVGVKNNVSIRTLSGIKDIPYLVILKSQDGLIWVVFKQSESGVTERFVQKW